jgi:formylglycine-generating enzyme required for sulfatase activity
MPIYPAVCPFLRRCLPLAVVLAFAAGVCAQQSLFKLPVLNPQQKVALVIGNANYTSSGKLVNTKRDAKLIGDILASLGFKVIYSYDATQADMEGAFKDFSAALGPNSVALFFYSGHGLQVGGRNFLVPVDYDLKKGVGGLWDAGIGMNMIAGKSRMNIIILDSCRTPVDAISQALGGKPGFTEFNSTPDGTFVAFSTSPGKTAADGTGENSPYTSMLAEGLRWRPAQLDQVFMYTQLRVEEITRGKQVPWRNSNTKALFFFSPDQTAMSPLASVTQNRTDLPGVDSRQFEFVAPFVNEYGTITSQAKKKATSLVENLGMGQLEMVRIDGGRFLMGAGEREVTDALAQARIADEFDPETFEVLSAELPRHAVNVRSFYMSRYEITQAQYGAVMNAFPPIPTDQRGPNKPVTHVTWAEAKEFCARLSKATGRLYRLPTEAEWEYAARAGSDTAFSFGETLNPQVAVYNSAIPYAKGPRGPRRDGPLEGGALNTANAFGLENMHGNVWEWVADYWHSDYDGAPVNGSSWDEPQAIESDDPDEADAKDLSRAARGGSWFSMGSRCRSASRYRFHPTRRDGTLGFRVVIQ